MNKINELLAILGSPRRGGNTEILLDALIKGAELEGAKIDKVILSELCIKPCIECGGCAIAGECVLEDDMQKIYSKLLSANAVIIASPIFFYSITATAKAFVDRGQALWSRKYILNRAPFTLQERRGYFLSVGATKGKRLFEGAALTMKYFFDAIDAVYSGELLFSGIEKKGEIINHPSAMNEAREFGRKIAL
ncbi:MAG: flavodoxin family protein [Pseudomonadota bacterium]